MSYFPWAKDGSKVGLHWYQVVKLCNCAFLATNSTATLQVLACCWVQVGRRWRSTVPDNSWAGWGAGWVPPSRLHGMRIRRLWTVLALWSEHSTEHASFHGTEKDCKTMAQFEAPHCIPRLLSPTFFLVQWLSQLHHSLLDLPVFLRLLLFSRRCWKGYLWNPLHLYSRCRNVLVPWLFDKLIL